MNKQNEVLPQHLPTRKLHEPRESIGIMAQMFAAQESIEANWRKIWKKISGRRIDQVFYFGSTVHWWQWTTYQPNRRTVAIWHPIMELTLNSVFVDVTEKGYELYLPAMIAGKLGKYRKGVVLADVKLHDVLTVDQFTAWLKKINEFPYV